MILLPPAPDKCQKCAVEHDDEMPHDQTSLHWQYWFYGQHGRWPTWNDALAHCIPEIKEQWIEGLKSRGIKMDE